MDKLAGLMRNSYGNYVVQKALKIAEGEDKKSIVQSIQNNIPVISDKKIRQKWTVLLEQGIENDPNFQFEGLRLED